MPTDDQSAPQPDHSPDSLFGCSHHWGPPIGGRDPIIGGEGLRHVCNLPSGHAGDCVCKCGDTHAPIPGPPAPPRCLECGGPRSVGGSAIRYHEPDCSVGQLGRRRSEVETEIRDALIKALQARRNDDEFMARLRDRVREDADILARLADQEVTDGG